MPSKIWFELQLKVWFPETLLTFLQASCQPLPFFHFVAPTDSTAQLDQALEFWDQVLLAEVRSLVAAVPIENCEKGVDVGISDFLFEC